MKTSCISLVIAFALVVLMPISAQAESLGTAFTYQGRLIDANEPAEGLYDLQFRLYDANSLGSQVGADINIPNVGVIDGYFTVKLDFGSVFDSNAVWLDIRVRPGELEDPNTYTALNPRQLIAPAPYALYAKSGTPGPQGEQGPIGLQGPKGDTGDTGPIGPQGIHGPIGATGSQGEQGPVGLQGPKGDTGDVGPMGPQGMQGPVGVQGPVGPAGASPFVLNGSDAYYLNGNVGIGTNTPAGKLDVWTWSLVNGVSTLDQQQTQTGDTSYGGTSNWQSFTPGVSGFLTQVDIQMRTPNCGIPDIPANMTVTIRRGEGAWGEVLASKTLVVTSYQWYSFAFSTHPWLDAGSKYTIHMTTVVGPCYWLPLAWDKYPGGTLGGTVEGDASFKTYMIEYTYGSALKVDSNSGNVGIGTAQIFAWHDQQVATNGYTWVGNILFQWGSKASTSDTGETFYFPITFPHQCFSVSTTLPGLVGFGTSSFTLDRLNDFAGSIGFTYMAIGY